jgi:hypothetical protein
LPTRLSPPLLARARSSSSACSHRPTRLRPGPQPPSSARPPPLPLGHHRFRQATPQLAPATSNHRHAPASTPQAKPQSAKLHLAPSPSACPAPGKCATTLAPHRPSRLSFQAAPPSASSRPLLVVRLLPRFASTQHRSILAKAGPNRLKPDYIRPTLF